MTGDPDTLADRDGVGPLAGRVIVVTGGNGGIGLGIAKSCGRRGAAIAVWGRSSAKNEAALDELDTEGIEAAAFVVDVTDEDAVDAAVSSVVDRFGRLDTMVANAGAAFPGATLDLPLDRWTRALDVSLTGSFIACRAAVRQMIAASHGGALVGVSSMSARQGAPGNIGYSAAKAGIETMIRGFAVEFARYGIRANTLMPGWTETDMTAPLMASDAFMEVTTRRTPARRWGTPHDMGEAAAYLADPTLTFHTGDTLLVDGGYMVF